MDSIENIKDRYAHLFMPVETNIDLNRVILSDENRQKVSEFLKENSSRERLMQYGLKPINRLLFYGDSGTGKTFLTKALSNHMGYTMLYVDIAKSLSEDSVAQNISDIFLCANSIKKCILFFDECDSIAWSRDSKTAEGGTVRRATNSLFQQLDQMDSSNIFVSATNMIKRLDPAFERRFDLKFEFRRAKCGLVELIDKFLYDSFILVNDVEQSKIDLFDRRISLDYYTLQIITERNMKKAILNNNDVRENKVCVWLSDVFMSLRVNSTAKSNTT